MKAVLNKGFNCPKFLHITKEIHAIKSLYLFCFTPRLPVNGNYFADFLITIHLTGRFNVARFALCEDFCLMTRSRKAAARVCLPHNLRSFVSAPVCPENPKKHQCRRYPLAEQSVCPRWSRRHNTSPGSSIAAFPSFEKRQRDPVCGQFLHAAPHKRPIAEQEDVPQSAAKRNLVY